MRVQTGLALVWLMGCAPAPAVKAPAVHAPPTATLTYLGVAGYRLDSAGHTMLFDPYVSRPRVSDLDMTLEPDLQEIERFTPARAEVIVVSHSHFDHVLDVPAIALRTGAVVLGTARTAELARAARVPEQRIVSAAGGEELVFPAFRVRAVKALHSLTGQVDEPTSGAPQLPLRARDYQEGGTLQYWVRFAGHTLYFVGTANLLEEQLRDVEADIAIIATGLREKVPDYTCKLMRALGKPKLVLSNHFDAWQEPLRPSEMTLSEETRADLAAFEREVHSCAPDTRVIVPEWLDPIAL